MLPKEIEIKFWKISALWSFLALLISSGYFLLAYKTYTFGTFVASLEATAAIMIAIAYAFGTFTYYTDFLDRELAYRKYFGLVGYIYLLIYGFFWITSPDTLFDPASGAVRTTWLLLFAMLFVLTF